MLTQQEIDAQLQGAFALVIRQPAEALALAEALWSQAEALGYSCGLARIAYLKGGIAFYQSRYDEAATWVEMALGYALQAESLLEQARAYALRGGIYRQKREFALALQSTLESLDLAEQLGDTDMMTAALNGLGGIYDAVGDYEHEIYYLERISAQLRSENAALRLGILLSNLAYAYAKTGRFEAALTLGEEAMLLLHSHAPDSLNLAHALEQFAHILLHVGRYEAAEQYLSKAFALATSLKLNNLSYLVQIGRGKLAQQRGDMASAIQLFQASLQLAITLDSERAVYEVHRHLAEALAAQGDYAAAYQHMRRYTELHEAIYSEQNRQRMQLLEVTHKTDMARREAQHLAEQNADLQQQRQRDLAYFERLNRLRSDAIGTTSHQLRTPLTAMGLQLHMLERALAPDSQGQVHLRLLKQYFTQMRQLIADLLDVARLETGRAAQVQMHDLAPILAEAAADMLPLAHDKAIRLVAEHLPSVVLAVDGTLLKQAVLNLLSNAVKYTPRGGEVRLSALVDAGEVVIEVQDSGVGIPAEALPHLFERFFRVEDERLRDIEGTGLGLYIVKTIVEQHGGQVSVHSVLDEGTRFSLRLPLLAHT